MTGTGYQLRFGPWHVGEVLGLGGYGEVRRARLAPSATLPPAAAANPGLDLSSGGVVLGPGDEVALKRLLPMWRADPEARRAFHAEAWALSRVRGPTVVRLLAQGETRRMPWLALSLIEGASLTRLLSAGPLSTSATVAVIHDLALGLAACHGAGVLHGDLAPGNGLIDAAGYGTLIDFGLATAMAPKPGHDAARRDGGAPRACAQPGSGTPAFLDPEAAAGLPRSPGSDVASLGLLWVRLRAGSSALGGGSAVSQRARAAAGQLDSALVDRAVDGLPSAIAAALRACLRLDQGPRPPAQTLADLLAPLAAQAAGRQALAARVRGAPRRSAPVLLGAEDRGEVITGRGDTTATRIATSIHHLIRLPVRNSRSSSDSSSPVG